MLAEWRDLAGHVRGTADAATCRPLDEIGRRRALDLMGLSRASARVHSARPSRGGRLEAEVAAHQQALIANEIAALRRRPAG